MSIAHNRNMTWFTKVESTPLLAKELHDQLEEL